MSTAASMVSKVLAPETKHKPKEGEQNRNQGSQEGQMETKDTTTENDDTLRDSTQPDHTIDLTTDPDKDPTTPIKHEEVEAAKTTKKEIGEPTDELANESPTDYENAPDNQWES